VDLGERIDEAAAADRFSGVVRVDRDGEVLVARAVGPADRAHGIANEVGTRFAIASGSKGFTALAVVSLIEDGTLGYGTTARSLLGDDLPLIADDVTVEHLLSHRSGIGDYLDEGRPGEITDHVMTQPVHVLETTEAFLPELEGYPTASTAGERFAYNNGGFMVLALLAERASGVPFHDLVRERVLAPAGMARTDYLRSDELPGDAALHYLSADGLRTNVFHLPVRGNGDGGAYTTAGDMTTFWRSLFAGRIVPVERVAEMVRPRSDEPVEIRRYGMGFWVLADRDVPYLEGYDAGVSFRSLHDPSTGTTATVLANWTDGAWSVAEVLSAALSD
jgi:CubicO group peptidase (beta-lactamase class C family)